MKRILLILIAMTFTLSACSEDAQTPSEALPVNDSAEFARGGGHGNVGLPGHGAVLRLKGIGHAYPGTVPDIDGDGVDDPADCFDVELYDAKGRLIGTATDCLANVTPVGDGLSIIGTTIFNLPNGTLITRGPTTVQPVTTGDPTPATHITGSIPMPGTNGVLSGTGAYSNFSAEVRLSGAVDMSMLASDGIIVFDCLFHIMPD